VVGVLIEVPVMLSVVKIVNSTRGWYEQGRAVQTVFSNGHVPSRE
jgi:arsenite transporter